MAVPMVENSIAFVEHGYCRIGIEKGAYKVVGCLYRISMILTFCRRCTLRLTVLYIISKAFLLKMKWSGFLRKKSFHEREVLVSDFSVDTLERQVFNEGVYPKLCASMPSSSPIRDRYS